MKTSCSLLGLLSMSLLGSSGVVAFSALPATLHTPSTSTSTTSLHAVSGAVSRRDCWKTAATAVAVVAVSTTVAPQPVSANSLSFDQVQDLLGTPDKSTAPYDSRVNTGGRPTFLVEPTDDFKANEAKASIFKRQQLQAKQAFATVQERITTDPNDENIIAEDLDEMRRQVKKAGGLPAGILKDDVIRTVRRRKSKKPKFWPVNCEIAYQDLMDEIRKQQSPNTERDMDNPF